MVKFSGLFYYAFDIEPLFLDVIVMYYGKKPHSLRFFTVTYEFRSLKLLQMEISNNWDKRVFTIHLHYYLTLKNRMFFLLY